MTYLVIEKYAKKFLGEKDIESVLQRLDRLTVEESRTTAAQTLDIVSCLAKNMQVVMKGDSGEHGRFVGVLAWYETPIW